MVSLKAIAVGAVLLALPLFVSAQVTTDISHQQNFKSRRIASTDPNHNNGDSRPIEPGQTITLGEIHGPGSIEHMWMTIAAQDKDALRELVLRVYWDGSNTPAVECPVGDFFAQGPGEYVEFHSAPVSVGGQMALNCYWPMPFRSGARFTVTNEGTGKVYALYYNIDYREEKSPEKNLLYFHTQYKTAFPAKPGSPVTICKAEGHGQYVGTVVTVLANSDGWWGEGNDLWHIDGSVQPTIEGTGTEDYFCGAWDFGHAFQTPYFGVTWYDNAKFGGEKRGIQNTAYRWHIPDPVVFQKSLLFQLQMGRNGVSEQRSPLTNSYTTVGFYYIGHPQADQGPIPPLSERIPTLIPLPTK